MPNFHKMDPIIDNNGEVIRALRPNKKMLREDLAWLENVGHRIFARLFKTAEEPTAPYLRTENVLRRTCYIIGVQLMERKHTERIEAYIKSNTAKSKFVSSAAPETSENAFFWCLHLIHQNQVRVKGGPKTWLTRDQKSKSARMLLYAYRNKVPPQHLIGFIYATGTHEIIRRNQEAESDIKAKLKQRRLQNILWREMIGTARKSK